MTQDQHQIYRMIFMMSPGVILFLGKFFFGKREFELIHLALLHLSIDWVGLLKHCFARRCNRNETKEFGFYPLQSTEEAFSVSEQKINNCRPRNISEHTKCEHVTHIKSDFRSSLI